MTTIDISVYLDRISTLQQTCITNSVSYPTYLTQQGHDLYWVNRKAPTNKERIAAGWWRWDITIVALLRVSPVTATVQTGNFETDLQQYSADVLEYFGQRPSMTINAEPTNETILTHLVPRSLQISDEGVQSVGGNNQNDIGTVFNISFSLNVKG